MESELRWSCAWPQSPHSPNVPVLLWTALQQEPDEKDLGSGLTICSYAGMTCSILAQHWGWGLLLLQALCHNAKAESNSLLRMSYNPLGQWFSKGGPQTSSPSILSYNLRTWYSCASSQTNWIRNSGWVRDFCVLNKPSWWFWGLIELENRCFGVFNPVHTKNKNDDR